MFRPIKNSNLINNYAFLVFAFLIKSIWFFAEYAIETDNALRMQFGISWTLNEFVPSHLIWAPLLSAYYSLVYWFAPEYFLYGDLILIILLIFWEVSIIRRTTQLFFSPNMALMAFLSLTFYFGHAFKYQINDVLMVYLFMEVVLALWEDKWKKALLWITLVPIAKYSAISIIFVPLIYYIFKWNRRKFAKRFAIILLVTIVNVFLYLWLTNFSGMAGRTTGFYLENLKLIYRLDHFWFKYGSSEYLFISFSSKLLKWFNVHLDVMLLTLVMALLAAFFFVFLYRRRNRELRIFEILKSKWFLLVIVPASIHVGYLLLLTLLLPLEKMPSSWTLGPLQDHIVPIEISRYFSFLNFAFFILFLKLLEGSMQKLVKWNLIYLIFLYGVSLSKSGWLFGFYQGVYQDNYKKYGVLSNENETHIYGARNYEAWKVFYILKKKDPADRFNK